MENQPLSRKEQRIADKLHKEERKQMQARKAAKKKMIIAVCIALGAVALVATLVYLQSQTLKIVDVTEDPGIGPKEAKVVIDEYSDFQCPGCAAAAPMVKSILAEYGDKVRFEYNDFPLPQHEYAPDAAIAAQCAFQQEKFFELHDVLFEKQSLWGGLSSHAQAQETIRGYAEELGLNMADFDACVVRDDIAASVDEDVAEGRKAGVQGTPTFFVNGKRIVDTPFSTHLKKAIDEALAQ